MRTSRGRTIELLAQMRPWRFEGEEDVKKREALEALKTAWKVLQATGNGEWENRASGSDRPAKAMVEQESAAACRGKRQIATTVTR